MPQSIVYYGFLYVLLIKNYTVRINVWYNTSIFQG